MATVNKYFQVRKRLRLSQKDDKEEWPAYPKTELLTLSSNSLYKCAKPYQATKQSLHTAKPDCLVGRDQEIAEINQFIYNRIQSKSSGCLYISGAPGTGKSAMVNSVLDQLQVKKGSHKTAFINCMASKDPSAVLLDIYEHLSGVRVKQKNVIPALESMFSASQDSIILVLDEIDQMDSKHHHILYRIFEWPSLEHSKLILIGIANALDLTDRILPRLQMSQQCRPTLMNVRPYTSAQITDILKHRLKCDNIMEPTAISFCARKVSAVAGDVRKALDICRRAVEKVEAETELRPVLQLADSNSPTKRKLVTDIKKVSIAHISQVISDVYGSSVSAANSSEQEIPLQQKLAVCALLVLLKHGKQKEVPLGKLHEVYKKICNRQQTASVDQSEFYSVLTLLDSRGIILLRKAKDTRLAKVMLKLDEQELEQTLKDRLLLASILNEGLPR